MVEVVDAMEEVEAAGDGVRVRGSEEKGGGRTPRIRGPLKWGKLVVKMTAYLITIDWYVKCLKGQI